MIDESMETNLTDSDLVASTLSGSVSSFEALVLRYQQVLFRQALQYVGQKEDAEDALQEALLKAYQSLPKLKDHGKFIAWMSVMVRNVCLNRLRSDRKRRALLGSVSQEIADRCSPRQPVDDCSTAFTELLSVLPELSGRAFKLHYLQDLSIEETAVELGATPAGTKQRLYRARRQLQEEIRKMTEDGRERLNLQEAFAAKTIARLLEQGRRDLLYMKPSEARARFREALKISPDHLEATLELACIADPVDGQSMEDAAAVHRAAQAAPDSFHVQAELARVWQDDREKHQMAVETCIELCDRRLGSNPNDTEALTTKAQMFIYTADYVGMEAVARRAVEQSPEDQRCLNYLALSLARQTRWEAAYLLYEKIYDLDGKTVWAYIALRQMGTYLGFHRGDWDGAVGMQEEVWMLTGRPKEAGNLIYYCGQAGQIGKAKQLFEEVKHVRHPARVYEVVGEQMP